IVLEHGKTLDEARGEMQRTLENVEAAAGTPALMMGYGAEDIAAGIDEECVPQPLGVFCGIAPFNFPSMVPYWYLPWAIACGNTYVIKPSELCPMSQVQLLELMHEAGLPPGVVNLVHGDGRAAEALAAHEDVAGVSFVGSTPVARSVYSAAGALGKRAQCQGGAKNCLTVLPDAPLAATVDAIVGSAFGCAGQRCLAGSLVIAVGDRYDELRDAIAAAAGAMRVGDGLDPATDMGPVVSQAARERVERYINIGTGEGANLILDGRGVTVEGRPDGYYIAPTVFDGVTPGMEIARDEIFGPVLGIIRVASLDEAVETINRMPYGNMASLFTSDGGAARTFKHEVACGNIGINIGVAAPVPMFPFSGMKQSFFGDLHGQGRDAIRFFTEHKVVISRWF
ncbi:MAG TPA: CoA-acylating methylmalonate-semialdehyde dehydrogenase, partial [Armatimonadota bacterium]|nr:CoA-acylating methylmalonate-semialdehyde dehydrogenase [Armatimonadota bacterium]